MGFWANLYIHRLKGVIMHTTAMFDQFSLHFPRIAEHATRYYEKGNYELIVFLDDGYALSFNCIDNSFRTLPPNPNKMTKDEFAKDFGYRLGRKLEEKHITQSHLSELTGIAQYLISDYINGSRVPGLYQFDKIAKALNCSMDEFRYI